MINNNKWNEKIKYYTVGTVQESYRKKKKNTTLSEQFKNHTEKQKILHCRNSSRIIQKNKKYYTVETVQ